MNNFSLKCNFLIANLLLIISTLYGMQENTLTIDLAPYGLLYNLDAYRKCCEINLPCSENEPYIEIDVYISEHHVSEIHLNKDPDTYTLEHRFSEIPLSFLLDENLNVKQKITITDIDFTVTNYQDFQREFPYLYKTFYLRPNYNCSDEKELLQKAILTKNGYNCITHGDNGYKFLGIDLPKKFIEYKQSLTKNFSDNLNENLNIENLNDLLEEFINNDLGITKLQKVFHATIINEFGFLILKNIQQISLQQKMILTKQQKEIIELKNKLQSIETSNTNTYKKYELILTKIKNYTPLLFTGFGVTCLFAIAALLKFWKKA